MVTLTIHWIYSERIKENEHYLRTAVIGDCERIRPLQKEIADVHHNGRPDLFKTEARHFTREAFAERLKNPSHTIYIAETDTGEVVGYAFAWIIFYRNHSTYIDFDCFYIDDVCVLQSYRRKGIGKRLFECCKQKAQEEKCKMIELGVWGFNKDAIAFYEICGMRECVRRMEYRLDN